MKELNSVDRMGQICLGQYEKVVWVNLETDDVRVCSRQRRQKQVHNRVSIDTLDVVVGVRRCCVILAN